MSRRSRSNSNSMGSRNSNGDTSNLSGKSDRNSGTKIHGFHGGFHGSMHMQTNKPKNNDSSSTETGRSVNGFHSKPKQLKDDIENAQQQQQQQQQQLQQEQQQQLQQEQQQEDQNRQHLGSFLSDDTSNGNNIDHNGQTKDVGNIRLLEETSFAGENDQSKSLQAPTKHLSPSLVKYTKKVSPVDAGYVPEPVIKQNGVYEAKSTNEIKDYKESGYPEKLVKPRLRLIHVLVLKSLNKTFETKYLVVPFKPEALKLGRPVSTNSGNSNANNNINGNNNNGNNNNNNNNNDKANKSEARPDNGHFDSRILSRNHASISCDPLTSNIYLKDLHSSNGTYLNGEKLKPEIEVEIKIGDTITLGADISSNGEHKKISALVEDINILPLVDDDYTANNNTSNNTNNNNTNNKKYGLNSTSVTQKAAFEAAMFGDVNDEIVSDDMWGQDNELLSGLFFNTSMGTSPSFVNVIKILNEEIMLEKAEQAKLQSMEQFLINYNANFDYLSKLRIEKNESILSQYQSNLKAQLTASYDTLLKEETDKHTFLQNENQMLKEKLKNWESEEIKNLKFKIQDLNTMLQVEKYKHGELSTSKDYNSYDTNNCDKSIGSMSSPPTHLNGLDKHNGDIFETNRNSKKINDNSKKSGNDPTDSEKINESLKGSKKGLIEGSGILTNSANGFEQIKHPVLARFQEERCGEAIQDGNDLTKTSSLQNHYFDDDNESSNEPSEESGQEDDSSEKRLQEAPSIGNQVLQNANKDKHMHTFAYLASISVVGAFTAFLAYSQNK